MNLKHSVLIAVIVLLGTLTACNSGDVRRNPGKAYAMDMTYSRAYDAYTTNPNTRDGLTSQAPVAGTIARGHALPDHMGEWDTSGAYYSSFTTNARFTDAEVKEGGRLFNIYCGICHGAKMDGQGPLFTSGKFASMPANLTDAKYLHAPAGQIYHAIKYGKGQMGSYASQLDVHQRWQIIAYIKKTQGAASGGDPFTMGVNTVVATVGKDGDADTIKGNTVAPAPVK